MLRALVLASLFALPALAGEAPAEAVDPVRAAMHTWHRGERVSGFVPFLGSGLVTGATGGALLAGGKDLGKGSGWVLAGFGALEVTAGLVFALTSYGGEAQRDALLTSDRETFLKTERARLTRITRVFQPILLSVEAAVALGGGGVAGLGALNRDDFLVGLGLGLAVQGLVMFILDWAVLDRAQAYASVLGL